MKKIFAMATALFLSVGVLSAAVALQEGPAAVVIAVQGTVQVEMGGAAPTPAGAGTRLAVGDRVIPDAGSSAVLIGRGGDRTEVASAYTVEAASAGGGGGDMFSRTVQVLGQVANANTDDLMDRQGMIRPIPGEPVLVAPRNELTVLSPRPDFVWQAVEGATGYTVQIRAQGGRPVRFESLPDTSWSYPASAPPLRPGTEYWWTVAPAGSGRATREQRFTVIGPEDYAAVARDLDALAEQGLDPSGDGAFLAAILFRDVGLYYDAAATLDFMEASGATLGPDAYLLLGEVRAELGDSEGATKAFDRADGMRQ